MPSWSWLRDLFGDKPDQGGLGLDLDQEGHAPPSRDTLAAIGELSRAVRNNPDAIEPYLALGNLYRAQGEIERAVELRANIIDRKGIPPALKAKALFELGRDYKRSGFMDRALGALEKARELVGNEPAILGEMARLAAETGEYAAAADLYARLGHPQAQAHYLVRLAVEGLAIQEVETGRQLISQALAVHPGSPEAWAETVILDLQAGFPPGSEERLAEALDAIEPGLRFVVLEMLLGSLPLGVFEPPDRAFGPQGLAARLLRPLADHEPDVLLQYYGGRLRQALGDEAGAEVWFERCVRLNPDFWPARLELLDRARHRTPPESSLDVQLEYFVSKAREVKRFACRVCGLKRDHVFYLCVRCQSWHSIGYRMRLTE
ncbi:Tetratricopeptide repeat-containing protein [Alkalidesulfovibrio alkalitolerans DSM 16529]|jgi:lipopolysaccharide biosynthesis regulator YciM|uniref:Tetratricopeptide repeat-containing protein n=1 Tax=Alkalidesulfovibrio alkalitolerans DSM 16529 TaxID=1121439 RepID=S7UDX2_9BACT|nr:Tetratricopeptide repeat-containing protein [Alkalidesulfovibrio alkalitolerans]EPR30413.1 Tetratricopeptide repeat-containing protein [Alkalidesulfovibrio alkalitolerans DSM 16529]